MQEQTEVDMEVSQIELILFIRIRCALKVLRLSWMLVLA